MALRAGSFAEYAVAREDKLAHKPAGLSVEQAAALPVSGLTALRAIDTAGVRPGQTVLVVGASGGVGTYAVRLAVAAGAIVTGLASTRKLDLVRDLGAKDVIDYTQDGFADGLRTFDLILDIGGITPIERLRRADGDQRGWRSAVVVSALGALAPTRLPRPAASPAGDRARRGPRAARRPALVRLAPIPQPRRPSLRVRRQRRRSQRLHARDVIDIIAAGAPRPEHAARRPGPGAREASGCRWLPRGTR